MTQLQGHAGTGGSALMNLLAAAEGLSYVQNLPNSKSKPGSLNPKPWTLIPNPKSETPALALTPHIHQSAL